MRGGGSPLCRSVDLVPVGCWGSNEPVQRPVALFHDSRVHAIDHARAILASLTHYPVEAVVQVQGVKDLRRRAPNDGSCGRIQLVNATDSLNISAGVLKPSVLRGLSFNCLAIALSFSWE